ncbi:MAG TPA: SRPBCC domain-containing protein [Candidatus Methylomirabilis sp.]
MKFEKTVTVKAPREAVWKFLWDVPRVAACLPGCKEAQLVEEGKRYSAVVGERVGPFKVEFPLSIDVLEVRAPEFLKARAGGKDTKVDSVVKVELDLRLVEAGGGTEMRLSTDMAILGKLGTLGHSVVVRKGDEVLTKFAEALRAQLET